MPIIDISNIESKLIGVCCLKGSERELLKSVWTRRFTGYTAFFTDVDPADSTLKMTRKIYDEVKSCGFQAMPGVPVILVGFLDMTEEVDPEFLSALAGVASRLNNALGCDVHFQLNFGFVGLRMLADHQMLRANAMQIVKSNQFTGGLYLVAEPDFGGDPESRWKAAMVYLDMLRRNAANQLLTSVSHPNGTIGFLRYGEYDENHLQELIRERDKLLRQLSSEGAKEFTNRLNGELAQMELTATDRFQVNAALHPIHPDMNVSGFWAVSRAKAGKNAEFNNARANTVNAVCETGNRLVQQIIDYYQEQIGDPKAYLLRLFREADVGIGFVEKRQQVQELLSQNVQAVSIPSLPVLQYNEKGYTEEINQYLREQFRLGIYQGKKQMLEALKNEYMKISDDAIAKERSRMQGRLDVININLAHALTKVSFCNIALGTGAGLEQQFTPILGASGDLTLKFLICRTQEDKEWIDSNFATVGPESRFYIDEIYGGLSEVDNAPIKVVQAALFDCTDERLEDILCEE